MIQCRSIYLCPSAWAAFVAWSNCDSSCVLLAANADLITVYHTLASMPSVPAGPSYFSVTGHNAPHIKNKPFGD